MSGKVVGGNVRKVDPRAVVVEFREIPKDMPERIGMMITKSYEVVAYRDGPIVKAGPAESWRALSPRSMIE